MQSILPPASNADLIVHEWLASLIGQTLGMTKKENAMLVLSRKSGQRVLIGDQISITIVKVSNGGVRIGIEAPAELPIIREELLDRLNLLQESIEGILVESAGNGNHHYQNRLRCGISGESHDRRPAR
jgi:carbon storage regulator